MMQGRCVCCQASKRVSLVADALFDSVSVPDEGPSCPPALPHGASMPAVGADSGRVRFDACCRRQGVRVGAPTVVISGVRKRACLTSGGALTDAPSPRIVASAACTLTAQSAWDGCSRDASGARSGKRLRVVATLANPGCPGQPTRPSFYTNAVLRVSQLPPPLRQPP